MDRKRWGDIYKFNRIWNWFLHTSLWCPYKFWFRIILIKLFNLSYRPRHNRFSSKLWVIHCTKWLSFFSKAIIYSNLFNFSLLRFRSMTQMMLLFGGVGFEFLPSLEPPLVLILINLLMALYLGLFIHNNILQI